MVGLVEGLRGLLEAGHGINQGHYALFASMFNASVQYSMTFSLLDPWYNNARPLKTYLWNDVSRSHYGRDSHLTYARTNACTLVTNESTMKLYSPGPD